MRHLPGIAGRLNRRQFAAVMVAVAGLAVILVAVALHSAGLPSFFPGGETGTLSAGEGITIEEPRNEIVAPIVEDGPAPTGPLADVGTRQPPPARPDGQPVPTTPGPTTTTTTTAPPPPTTTSTTLPVLPLPIGAPFGRG